jgi:SnoaL-like domain
VRREDLGRWIGDYERAWRTPGTTVLEKLFTSDAIYIASPFEPPIQGREAIASFWEAEREGPDEVFSMDWEPVAVEENVGVIRLEVRYGDPTTLIYRDLWIVTLDENGRCTAFEEWPFFPGQPRAASRVH